MVHESLEVPLRAPLGGFVRDMRQALLSIEAQNAGVGTEIDRIVGAAP